MKLSYKSKSIMQDALAEYSHNQAWSGWMNYMFSKGIMNEDGSWTMPKEYVDRWKRQTNTLYHNLSEQEKKSDLKQADKMLELIDIILFMEY